jgi:predicted nuclease with TOPRIM domain
MWNRKGFDPGWFGRSSLLNILAKICIVLLVVTSLIAAVVFTSMATVTPVWRTLFQQEQEAYNNLEATYQEKLQDIDRLTVALNDARQKNKTLKQDHSSQLAQLTQENIELKQTNTELTTEITKIKDRLQDLAKTSETNAKIRTNLQASLTEANKNNNELQAENARLADQLKACRAENERYERTQKVIKENAEYLKSQLAEKNKVIQNLRATGAKGASTEVAPIATRKITGSITAIDNDVASANVGSAHGVQKGMELIIFRGDQFVGHLKVEDVGVNESAGVVVDRRLTPKQGDNVASSLD